MTFHFPGKSFTCSGAKSHLALGLGSSLCLPYLRKINCIGLFTFALVLSQSLGSFQTDTFSQPFL